MWSFGAVEQPLVMWLWIGAGLIGLGSVLSAIPGRRRRPTDPVSTPVVVATTPRSPEDADRSVVRPLGSTGTPVGYRSERANPDDHRHGADRRSPERSDPEAGGTAAGPANPGRRPYGAVGGGRRCWSSPPAWSPCWPPDRRRRWTRCRTRWWARWHRRSAGVTLAGTHYALPTRPGRFVVVNFFASWCTQCQSEGPELVKFAFEHQQPGDASVLSVVFSDSLADARASQAQLGATWPTMADAGGAIALAYGVRELPSTFVIAPDGRVVAYIVAPVTAADLDQVIARARASHA